MKTPASSRTGPLLVRLRSVASHAVLVCLLLGVLALAAPAQQRAFYVNGHPSWSPDGTQIVFAATREVAGIFVVSVDGSGLRPVIEDSSGMAHPDWSPDGSRIVFESDRDGNPEIYSVAPDGSDLTRLTHRPEYDANPFWSADGTEIGFWSRHEGRPAFHVMDANGANPRPVPNRTARDFDPARSPDGTRVVSWDDRAYGNSDITVSDPDGSNRAWLTDSPGPDAAPQW